MAGFQRISTQFAQFLSGCPAGRRLLLAWILAFSASLPGGAQESEPDSTEVLPIEVGPGGRIVRESALQQEAEAGEPFHLHFLWESRYASEGRDSLDGGSLISTTTEFTLGPITFAPWFAYGPDQDYSELNLNLVYGYQLGEAVELYVGYTHLQFPGDQSYDNEIGAGLVYSEVPWFDVFGDAVYSFEAEGTYFEAGLVRQFPLADEVMLGAFALMGFNGGYVPDGHDGADHLAGGLELEWLIAPNVLFTGFAGYSWAIDRDPVRYEEDELLRNFFWGSAGLKISF